MSGEQDIFLDLDPEGGIVAGERWVKALEDAATRCEAVLFLVSEIWLASKWCGDEYRLANRLNKKLFALLIDDIVPKGDIDAALPRTRTSSVAFTRELPAGCAEVLL